MSDATPELPFPVADSDERWLAVPGWEGFYEVSDLGRIRSVDRTIVRSDGVVQNWRGLIRKPTVNPQGYLRVVLAREGGRVKATRTVHTLVAQAFLGARPDGMETRHLDGVKLNCKLSNLVYGTASANILDQVRHGVHNMARKTECSKGHEFTPANTLIDGLGKRVCRKCNSLKAAAWKARNPERARQMAKRGTARYLARKRAESA